MAATTRSSMPSLPAPLLGSVLVTGGCGFLGFHLVKRLLADADVGHVYVIDRDVRRNTHDHPKATYIQGSVTDASTLATILDRAKPRVIFHAASPSATYGRRGDFRRTNVAGTKTVLDLARKQEGEQSPMALVYTSSIDIYSDPPHRHVKETHPTWQPDKLRPWSGVGEYDRTKAEAHGLVLDANCAGLKTAAIVPAHMYGTRDSQGLSLFFDTFDGPGRPLFQVGGGANVASFVEAGNCAAAHVLAAKALLDPSRAAGKVDGEAFNVSDGVDLPLWWHTRLACAYIRGYGEGGAARLDREVTVIPAWVLALVVAAVKWLLLVFTLGYAEPPPALGRNGYSWCVEEHTYDITKAREVLGYEPVGSVERHEEVVREAVEWERRRRNGEMRQ